MKFSMYNSSEGSFNWMGHFKLKKRDRINETI